MWKMFSFIGNYRWCDKLTFLLDFYHSRTHSTIKMRPKDVTKDHEQILLQTVYNYKKEIVLKTRFELGDHVRISKHKGVFEKGYTPNWGTEIFKIVKLSRMAPEVYYLQDYRGEEIQGAFYKNELQKVKDPNGYLVETVIRKKGNKAFVKFLGFDSSHNAWIDL
jgi:hypothetical protein